ncbi:MAG TPA: 2-oxoacid:acceptor oxidoreductase subunit alpha [Candidatus Tectomicrobia bacterium]|nr:2-oxoacid:acceptor oxidoreductase subunit alpha [Candidatus Tectomicrobia bacterium]
MAVIVNQLKLLAGGEAGDGVFAVSDMLALMFARAGLEVLTTQTYSSRIRGGHINASVRVAEQELRSQGDELDLLIALDLETVELHRKTVRDGGVILYDNSQGEIDLGDLEQRQVTVFPIAARKIARERLSAPIMKNIVMTGAALTAVNFDPEFEFLGGLIRERFLQKGEKVVAKNLEAAAAGRELVLQANKALHYKMEKRQRPRKMLLQGSDAVSFGALVAGCRFMASYPITPASDIMEYLVSKFPKFNGVMVQAEDELSAINMAVGAAFSGARSLAASSGPGIALMIEALGLAAVTETPLVLVDVQRCGPSTGMPTRMEQADLNLLIYGAHGEVPRIVIAPSDIEECFYQTIRAFNLAEKYQCPVIIATDQYLSQSQRTTWPFDLSKAHIDRGWLLTDDELNNLDSPFRRYLITERGISPRTVPSQEKGIFKTTGVEHVESGNATENPEARTRMMNKRFLKLETFRREDMQPPRTFGNPESDITIVGWGSTKGVILEVMERFRQEEGIDLRLMQVLDIWPFPDQAAADILRASRQVVVVENNFTGQMANLIRQQTGIECSKVVKYNGAPFAPKELYQRLKELIVVAEKIPA